MQSLFLIKNLRQYCTNKRHSGLTGIWIFKWPKPDSADGEGQARRHLDRWRPLTTTSHSIIIVAGSICRRQRTRMLSQKKPCLRKNALNRWADLARFPALKVNRVLERRPASRNLWKFRPPFTAGYRSYRHFPH